MVYRHIAGRQRFVFGSKASANDTLCESLNLSEQYPQWHVVSTRIHVTKNNSPLKWIYVQWLQYTWAEFECFFRQNVFDSQAAVLVFFSQVVFLQNVWHYIYNYSKRGSIPFEDIWFEKWSNHVPLRRAFCLQTAMFIEGSTAFLQASSLPAEKYTTCFKTFMQCSFWRCLELFIASFKDIKLSSLHKIIAPPSTKYFIMCLSVFKAINIT